MPVVPFITQLSLKNIITVFVHKSPCHSFTYCPSQWERYIVWRRVIWAYARTDTCIRHSALIRTYGYSCIILFLHFLIRRVWLLLLCIAETCSCYWMPYNKTCVSTDCILIVACSTSTTGCHTLRLGIILHWENSSQRGYLQCLNCGLSRTYQKTTV